MYTERNGNFSIKNVILQFLFIALFIFILVWLFPMKSDLNKALKNSTNDTQVQDMSVFYDQIFNNNVIAMKDAAKSYYTTERLPKNVGDKVSMNLGEMLNKKIILPFVDSKGKQCDLVDSYVEVTKNDNEFVMKVNLKCTNQENYLLVYMGCYDYCQTAICEKNKSDIKTPVVYNKETAKPATSTTTNNNTTNNTTVINNNITNITNNITNSITNNIINNIIVPKPEPTPTPNPEPTPDPEPTPTPDKNYEYEYKKTTSTCSDYSSWSEWSEERVEPTDNRQVQYRKIKRTTLTGYKTTTANDTSKPIYGSKEVAVGTLTQNVCTEYGYTQTGAVAYTAWEYAGYITTTSVLKNTDLEKYVPVTDTETLCQSYCSSTTGHVYKKYVRSVVSGATYSCKSTATVTKLITANKTIITGYEKKTTSEPVYETKELTQYRYRTKTCSESVDTKWSVYNDTKLLNAGYKYTGNKREK